MSIGIDGKKKPNFTEGHPVTFNLDGKIKGNGVICGKSSEGLIDFWIVRVGTSTIENYPFSCIVVPHPLLGHKCDFC